MKLGPATKLNKRNKATPKKLSMTLHKQILTSLFFFQFMVNMQPSRSPISDATSIKRTFSITINFYLTKPGNRTKKSLAKLAKLRGSWY